MVKQGVSGFTLIELMIVVVIIGILASIAYPSYQGYIEKGKRVDMMAEMQQIGSRIEANKITYKRYDRIPLGQEFSNTTTLFFTSPSKLPSAMILSTIPIPALET